MIESERQGRISDNPEDLKQLSESVEPLDLHDSGEVDRPILRRNLDVTKVSKFGTDKTLMLDVDEEITNLVNQVEEETGHEKNQRPRRVPEESD
jgi:hypothetical protein